LYKKGAIKGAATSSRKGNLEGKTKKGEDRISSA